MTMEQLTTLLNDLLFGAGLGCIFALVIYREKVINFVKKVVSEE